MKFLDTQGNTLNFTVAKEVYYKKIPTFPYIIYILKMNKAKNMLFMTLTCISAEYNSTCSMHPFSMYPKESLYKKEL